MKTLGIIGMAVALAVPALTLAQPVGRPAAAATARAEGVRTIVADRRVDRVRRPDVRDDRRRPDVRRRHIEPNRRRHIEPNRRRFHDPSRRRFYDPSRRRGR